MEVRTVKCPECGAEPSWPCIGKRGPRYANHQSRVLEAQRQFGIPPPAPVFIYRQR